MERGREGGRSVRGGRETDRQTEERRETEGKDRESDRDRDRDSISAERLFTRHIVWFITRFLACRVFPILNTANTAILKSSKSITPSLTHRHTHT